MMPWSPRALVLVARGVDALGDVGGLGVQVDGDVVVLPVETVLLVADILDGRAGQLLQVLEGHRIGAAHLAGDHDAVGGRQGLDAEAGLRHHRQVGVDHGVGDPVADLVRMAFGDRLAREQVIGTRHGVRSPQGLFGRGTSADFYPTLRSRGSGSRNPERQSDGAETFALSNDCCPDSAWSTARTRLPRAWRRSPSRCVSAARRPPRRTRSIPRAPPAGPAAGR